LAVGYRMTGDYLMARLRFHDDEPVPVERLDWALELGLRYPYSTEHYRARAEVAGRRRSLAKRLSVSVPFEIPAGTLRSGCAEAFRPV